jgi:hypothetical protein
MDDCGELIPDVRFDLRIAVELDDCVIERTGVPIGQPFLSEMEDWVSMARFRVDHHHRCKLSNRAIASILSKVSRTTSRESQSELLAEPTGLAYGFVLRGLALTGGNYFEPSDVAIAAKFAMNDSRAASPRGPRVKEWREPMVREIFTMWRCVGGHDDDPVWDSRGNDWIRCEKVTPLARWLSILIEQIERERIDSRTVRRLVDDYRGSNRRSEKGVMTRKTERKWPPIAELNWNRPLTPGN